MLILTKYYQLSLIWGFFVSFLFHLSLSLCLVFHRNPGAGYNAVYCTEVWKNNVRAEKRKNQQGAISLCWIVLFDLECSERRALCNVFSTHMANCVTAKHTTRGEVVVAVVVGELRGEGWSCGKKGGGRPARESDRATKGANRWQWEVKCCRSCWCWVTFLIKAAQSSSCNVGLNKPHNETWECPLVMVQTSICCSLPKTRRLNAHHLRLMLNEEI